LRRHVAFTYCNHQTPSSDSIGLLWAQDFSDAFGVLIYVPFFLPAAWVRSDGCRQILHLPPLNISELSASAVLYADVILFCFFFFSFYSDASTDL
jgi:hypothetical protein